ncbi:MAG: hypothetical protein AB7U73_14215 [Pirellulales bacterium]
MFARNTPEPAESAWRRRRSSAVGALLAAIILAAVAAANDRSTAVRAAPPRVTFDATGLAACRDATPDDFTQVHPGCKLVEARFQVSVRIEEGRGDEVATVSLEFSSPEGRFRIQSYDPQTWWVSDKLGPIEVTTQHESSAGSQAEIKGTIKADAGPAEGVLQPNLGRTSSQRTQVQEHYSRRPESQRVLVTGTTDAEHGVFFRWRRSEQATLEGRFDFSCRLIVPTAWRADWAAIRCTAEAETSSWLGNKRQTCGETKHIVALYSAGDAEARLLAEQLAETASGAAHANRSTHGGAMRHTTLRPTIADDETSSANWLAELTRWLHR